MNISSENIKKYFTEDLNYGIIQSFIPFSITVSIGINSKVQIVMH